MIRRRTPAACAAAAALFLIGAVAFAAAPPPVCASSLQQLPATWNDNSASSWALENLIDSARRVVSEDFFWVGYTFALRDGVHIGCDDWSGRSISFGGAGARLYLDAEAPRAMPCDRDFGLFLRVEGDAGAAVDARLLPWRGAAARLDDEVVWAGEFGADASAAWLRSAVLDDGAGGLQVSGREASRTRERLLSAIAVHDSPSAVDVVLEALNSSYPQELREAAVFWAAQVGGQDGLVELLSLAREDADAEMRKEAVFWLAHAAGERVAEDLVAIAEEDPETEVQQSAIFALSQIGDGGATDELIEIVRSHDNPEVIRSALFWLGQSGDPRAVQLIEEILFGRVR